MAYTSFPDPVRPASVVLHTRCCVPQLGWDPFSRDSLLSRLQDSTRKYRLTLISAPSGYGKTTLVADFANRQAGSLGWISLEDEHNDPLLLLAYLQTALQRQLPSGFDLSLALEPRAALTLLLNALDPGGAAGSLLILDNLHRLVTPDALALVGRLIEYAGTHLHFIALAWGEPRLDNLSRLRAAGQVATFTADDLRFTPDETQALLEQANRAPLPARATATIDVQLEGWALGVRLLADSVLRAPVATTADLANRLDTLRPQLFDYLAQEVLNPQPAALRTFLLHTAILDTLDAAACRALGGPGAQQWLTDLDRHLALVQPVDTERRQWRYRVFFRQFLQHVLERVLEPAAIRELHGVAATHYLAARDEEQALAHLLAAGAYEPAADLLGRLLESRYAASHSLALAEWLPRFPVALSEAHPWLILAQARLSSLSDNPGATEQLYEHAETVAREMGDQRAIFLARYYRAGWLLRRGRFRSAAALYRQTLPLATDAAEQADLLSHVAYTLYMGTGQTDEALDLLDQALDLFRGSDRSARTINILQLQADMRFNLGDLRGALAGYHTVLDLAAQEGNLPELAAIRYKAAYIHVLCGEWTAGEALAEQEHTLAHDANLPRRDADATLIRGMVAQGRWHFAQARAYYEEALTIYRQLNDQRQLALVLTWLGTLARREGKLEEAVHCGEASLALRQKLNVPYELGLTLISLGRSLAEQGAWDQARTHWTTALEIFTCARAHYMEAQLHIYLAGGALQNPEGAQTAGLHSHLTAALALCWRYDYSFLFTSDPAWSAPLLVAAIEAGIDVPTATQFLQHIGKTGTTEALTALTTVKPGVPRAKRAVAAALDTWLEVPPEPLYIRTLGTFTLQRGERVISNWPRASARAVFQYLLLFRSRPVPMEELTEVFWPDSAPAPARKNLHQAVAALRHALEPELPMGIASRYLRVNSGTYQIVLPTGSTLADEQFLSQSTVRQSVPVLEQAVRLYQGDYLADQPYAEWTMPRREQLRVVYHDLLLRLAAAYFAADRLADCITVAQTLWDQEPWSEEAVLWLMQAHAARGNRAPALRAYQTLAARLQAELNITPRADVTAFYQQLLRS